MGDRYSAVGETVADATPGDTMLGLTSIATRRAHIYDMGWGAATAPADNSIEWLVRRSITNSGTGTAVVEVPLDPDHGVANLVIAFDDYSAEPTGMGTGLINIGLNQRASWRWVAAPEGEIVTAAVAAGGVFITPILTSGPTVKGYMHWDE